MSTSVKGVFSSWKAARDQLELAVDSFLGACTTLHQFIDQPPANCKDLGSIEDNVLKITSQIGEIASIAAKVSKSATILCKVTNTSTTLVRINVLPLEILSRIFALTVWSSHSISYFADPTKYPLLVILAVCTRWRRLALDTRSLWSHVSVGGAPLESGGAIKERRRVQMWLERAHGAALHIGFRAPPSDPWLVSIVQPHMPRVTSLAFHFTSGESFQDIMNTFASCSAGLLTFLSVKSILKPYGPWGGGGITQDAGAPHSPWQTKLHGLVHLELIDLPQELCPNLEELVWILSNNPGLQTLRLRIVEVMPSQHDHHPRIHLPKLRMLDIPLWDNLALQQLLSVLMPGERELDARIEMPSSDNHVCDAAIHALFRRSNVTRFTAWNVNPNSSAQLAGYLDCLPNLRTLILDASWEGGSCTSLAALMAGEQGNTRARCPNLQELALLGAKIGSDAQQQLKLIVSTHHLRNLIFGRGTRIVSTCAKDLDESDMLEWIRQRGQAVVYDSSYGPKD
ncbi:hypothetical protein FS749_016322 [Ceratobasidium sp. UAMH 11750]|nr:hypothetical protein FS749_016322 [Ceratobasidium sp. UAMH 11750]